MATSRIQQMFERLRGEKKAALVAYLTAGDPNPGATAGLVAAMERGGADLIELGVPFSDPIADGPVIQRGADRALKAGTTLPRVLEIAAEIRKTSQIPILLFSYLNPMLRYGFEKLAKDAKACGIDGVLMTDASVEEAESYVQAMRDNDLDTVFLAAPTSTERRLELVGKYSSGFVYLVSRTGVTGEQESLSDSIQQLVDGMRKYTSLPVAVGFGISTHSQYAAVAGMADGVVVGSAIVRVIEKYGTSPDLESQLESFTRSLKYGG